MAREDEIRFATNEFLDKNPNLYYYADAFEAGAKWADKTLIDNACEWLKAHINGFETDEDCIDFRRAMEE